MGTLADVFAPARARRVYAALLACLAAGCFAELDWRELRVEDGGYSVSLPGRPSEQARPLAVTPQVGAQITMRQWSARAKESVFAAGYADFPFADEKRLAEVSDALVRNISGRVEKRVAVALDSMSGLETVATGRSADAPLALRVRIYADGPRLYQVAVLGRPGDIPEDELDRFFSSFRLLRPTSSAPAKR
jgi:hypothetical protein